MQTNVSTKLRRRKIFRAKHNVPYTSLCKQLNTLYHFITFPLINPNTNCLAGMRNLVLCSQWALS